MSAMTTTPGETRVNLYTANVQTVRAIMYGKTPKVDCARRFADSADDVARVSAEVFERILNSDIEDDGDGFAEACGSALDDRLNPGLGVVRVRYEVEMGKTEGTKAILHPVTGVELAPALPPQAGEAVGVRGDGLRLLERLLVGPCAHLEGRSVGRLPRADVSQGAEGALSLSAAEQVPLNSKRNGESVDAKKDTPWGRADVWEVWSKEDEQVYWVSEAYHEVLDTKDDPYGWTVSSHAPGPCSPTSPPLASCPGLTSCWLRTSTTRWTPSPLASRMLERAIVVRGIYDSTAGAEVGRMLSEAGQNELIPVKNWPMLQEKGGHQWTHPVDAP
jgi:hypothetical protein